MCEAEESWLYLVKRKVSKCHKKMSPDSAGSSSLFLSLDSFWVVVAKNEDGARIFTTDGTMEAPPFFYLSFIKMKDGKIIERKLRQCKL